MAVQEKEVKLIEVVNALPPDLAYADFIELAGHATSFTRAEADEIIRRGNSMHKATSGAGEPPVVAPNETAVTSVVQEPEALLKPVYMRDADAYCKGLLERSACNTPINNKGVLESGFCDTCWYPSIADDYQEYKALRDEGFKRNEAAVMAGIIMAPEKKRIVSYAAKTRKQRSDVL